MNVAIDSSIYRQASDYAQSRGLNLTEVIENFIVRFIGKDKVAETEQPVPDIVLSLLGAGEPVADDDLYLAPAPAYSAAWLPSLQ